MEASARVRVLGIPRHGPCEHEQPVVAALVQPACHEGGLVVLLLTGTVVVTEAAGSNRILLSMSFALSGWRTAGRSGRGGPGSTHRAASPAGHSRAGEVSPCLLLLQFPAAQSFKPMVRVDGGAWGRHRCSGAESRRSRCRWRTGRCSCRNGPPGTCHAARATSCSWSRRTSLSTSRPGCSRSPSSTPRPLTDWPMSAHRIGGAWPSPMTPRCCWMRVGIGALGRPGRLCL